MATSPYNNPMFGNSISSLISNLIPSPGERANAELTASKALLSNQTALYRDQIGVEGLQGDLSAMMIRALQTGPEYAKLAPGIGDQAIKFGALGYGDGPYDQSRAGPAFAAMGGFGGFGGGGRRGGGSSSSGRGGGDPNGGVGGYDWNELTATEKAAVSAQLRRAIEAGQFPEGTTEVQLLEMLANNPGGFANPNAALGGMADESNWQMQGGEEVPVNTFVGPDALRMWWNPELQQDTETQGGEWAFTPGAVAPNGAPGIGSGVQIGTGGAAPAAPGGPQAANALEQARTAIANGADPAAVGARLRGLGIDPGGL